MTEATENGDIEPTSERRTTQVHIDFNRVLDVMGTGVRRASAFLALGLRTAADTTIDNANLEEGFQFQFFPESVPKETITKVREAFSEWVVGNGLKELDQHFSLFLDAVNEILTLSEFHGQRLAQKALDSVGEFSNQSSVALKLDQLKGEHGVDSELRDHLAGLSKARNALSHNGGQVRRRQLTSDDALELSWIGLDFVVGDKVYRGTQVEGVKVDAGQNIKIQFGSRTRCFPLWSKVELDSGELSEICFTYWNQAVRTVKAVEKIVGSKLGTDTQTTADGTK